MGIDPTKVMVGLPDQSSTTGAILRGPVLKNIPADITAALTAVSGYDDCGYVSEDGANLTTEISTVDVREWGGAIVRRLLESFTGTIGATMIQADYDGWCHALGEENVTKIPASSSHGEQLHIKIGANLTEPQCWALLMKDGDARMVVLVPNGQVTGGIELTFAGNEVVKLPLEISCNDDGTGDGTSIHIYTDDGQKTSA